MLLRGTAIVSLLTLVSRILGFVRDLLVARLLGASLFADAFFVAFRIPNLLRSFAAEGALTSAFIPVFSSALSHGKDEAQRAFKRIATFVICLTSILTIVGIIFLPEVISIIAPGFRDDPDKRALVERLGRIMLPYIIFVSLVALLNAALNTLKVFGASAWAQVIMNLVLIVGAVCAIPFEPEKATLILAVSVLVGGLVQVVAQIPACRKAGLSPGLSSNVASPEVREVIRLMLPATVGASVYQLNIFISTLLASLLVEGSVSWLFYADRVSQFPIGIFSVALASVLLPTLANASASADKARFDTVLSDSLRFTSFVIIPMATGLWLLATPLTSLLFERGAFDHHATLMTASAIQALALGLWSTSCHSMVVRAFMARKDTITPTLIGVVSLLIYVSSALALMGPIAESPSHTASLISSLQRLVVQVIPLNEVRGHVGLALASSIAATTSLTLAIIIHASRSGAFPWRPFIRSTLQAVGAAGCMALVVSLCTPFEAPAIVSCSVGAVLGAVSYCLASVCLRSEEMKATLSLFKRLVARA
jgi:putative peptidoglycan lipid II flippase